MAVIGLLIAGHWVAFFTAIKVSNISTALTVLSTNAIFTSLVSPLILGNKLKWTEVMMGAVGTIGLAIIFHFESQFYLGIIWALLAAFLAAVFSSFNARMVRAMEPITMTLYELVFANFWVFVYLLMDTSIGLEWEQ